MGDCTSIALVFVDAGFFTYAVYKRWLPPESKTKETSESSQPEAVLPPVPPKPYSPTLDQKIKDYHNILKQRTYEKWRSVTPILTNHIHGFLATHEMIAIAKLDLQSMVEDDPNHGYYNDALSHLVSYSVNEDDLRRINTAMLDNKWTASGTFFNVRDLADQLKSHINGHNSRVKGFSKWEGRRIKRLAVKVGLGIDNASTDPISPGRLNARNFVRHCDSQSTGHARVLQLVQLEGSSTDSVLRSIASDPSAAPEERVSFDVARSHDREKLSYLNGLLISFEKERGQQIEPITRSIDGVKIGYKVLTDNIQIAINEVTNGTFQGHCDTEKRIQDSM